jgi:DNA-binding LacI/PurR family transcriptional regulator
MLYFIITKERGMLNGAQITGHLPKGLRVKELLRREILEGKHGGPGAPFMPVRELAESRGISLVTAQKIVVMLKEDGVLSQSGRRHCVSEAVRPVSRKEPRIAVIVTMLDNPFFSSLLKNIELAAEKRGVRVISASSNYDVEREEELLEMFAHDGVDGILACPANDKSSAPAFSALKIPCALIGRKISGVDLDAVLVNNFSAGQGAARHLTGIGLKHFAYAGFKNHVCDPRRQGFISGLAEAGFELSCEALVSAENNRLDLAVPDLERLLESLPKPAGVFCFHDLLAGRLLRLAARMSLRVPDDIAVIGFDNLPVAAELSPSLTSVAYPIDQMAETALSMLMGRVNGVKGRAVTSFLDPELIIRESTAGVLKEADGAVMGADCMAYNLA